MKRYFLLILLIFMVFGCNSKDKIKPSADSLTATDAFNLIDKIKTAYEEKNSSALSEYMELQVYENTSGNLSFDKADLAIENKFVKITDTSVIVNLVWQGAWWFKSEGNIQQRGIADFVFDKSTMKLSHIVGDNPFLTSFGSIK